MHHFGVVDGWRGRIMARVKKTRGAVTHHAGFLTGARQPAANVLATLSTNIKGLQDTATETVKSLSKEEGERFKQDLIQRINMIPDNIDIPTASAGGANDKGEVHRKTRTTGYTVIWSGPQVPYLEYGTGTVGDGTYPGPMPSSYHYGNEHFAEWDGQDYWIFEDEEIGHSVWSAGWAAYAPMWNTANWYRYSGVMSTQSMAKMRQSLSIKMKEGL